MKTHTFTHQTIDEFISEKEIAIAGVSRNPKKFGYVVYKTLKEKGFKVYPVNPNAETIDGESCFRSVEDIPENIKNLLILLKPAEVPEVVDQSIKKGFTRIWLQQGSNHKEAIEKARKAGVEIVTNKCILMYANPTGFHKFHTRIIQFIGKY